MAISMLKIRRPLGRLIFNMGIAIPGKTVFLIETAPRSIKSSESLNTHCHFTQLMFGNIVGFISKLKCTIRTALTRINVNIHA